MAAEILGITGTKLAVADTERYINHLETRRALKKRALLGFGLGKLTCGPSPTCNCARPMLGLRLNRWMNENAERF